MSTFNKARRLPCVTLAAALAALAAPALAQTPAAPRQLDRAEVIGTSPLPGQGIDRNLLPYDTQVVRRAQLDAASSDNITDFLSRRLPGLQTNDIQGSPFQADLTYRGFRASGLIGASQGLSVYLDGVRINEPFGDVVNWDLIPEFSIASLTLVPGANPAFGLNTIGGALSFTTSSGLSAPGVRAEVGFGSFGRKRIDASYGRGSSDGWHQYAGLTLFDEDGWRDFSEGNLAQAFVKLGRESGPTSWDVGVLAGRSTLIGNGLTPAYTIEEGIRSGDLYAARREAIYTHPDKTRNELLQIALNARHRIDAATLLSGLVYARGTRRTTVNGDTSDDADPLAEENASLNGSNTRQTAGGLAAALSKTLGTHQLQFGATLDASKVRFRQQEQEGSFDATRGVIAGDEEAELSAEVSGRSIALGLYATDTWALLPQTHVTATLHANHARVDNTLTSVDDDSGEIEARPEEKFRYSAINPALGVAHRLGSSAVTLFANVARNNRVPTVIELGCADPDEPCRLPAGLQSDPFLEQVRSTTVEAGARWTPANGTRVSVAAYRTDNRDDIVFGSVSVTGQLGFFRNFPRTRHQGVDAQVETTLGPLSLQASYSHLNATYQAADTLRLGDRNVAVTPGTRIAGLPRHTLKFGADWQFVPGLSIGGDVQVFSSRGTLGNEDGLAEDGEDEIVDLGLPGYGIVNLRASWKPASSWELFARVNNVADRRYETFGAIAGTVFDAQGNFTGVESDAVFVAPGAPRSLFVGARLRF